MQKKDKAKADQPAPTLDAALEALKTYDWGADTKPLEGIDAAVVAAHGNDAARGELETKLVAVLESDVTYDAKDVVCRKLMIVGSAACVPALAKLLTDEKHSHLARVVLERIQAPEAGAALRDAVAKTKGKQQVGVIGSIGARKDKEAVAALKALLANSDEAVAAAAATALGNIGNADASAALADAKPAGKVAQQATTDGKLRCAEALLATGDKAAALAIYKTLATGEQPKHVKLAGTRGMLACAGK